MDLELLPFNSDSAISSHQCIPAELRAGTKYECRFEGIVVEWARQTGQAVNLMERRSSGMVSGFRGVVRIMEVDFHKSGSIGDEYNGPTTRLVYEVI